MRLKTINPLRTACIAVVALFLAGCTQWRYDMGDHISHANLDKLQQGMPLTQVRPVALQS